MVHNTSVRIEPRNLETIRGIQYGQIAQKFLTHIGFLYTDDSAAFAESMEGSTKLLTPAHGDALQNMTVFWTTDNTQ